MENVPRVLDFIPDEVPLRKLGVDKRGSLSIPRRVVLNSADFGTPQLRKRAFSGVFPELKPTVDHWRSLRDVIDTLPDPLAEPTEIARDPIYSFELPTSELTDHYSNDLRLTDEEIRENRKAKEDHSWYGKMAFPDELDRPGRTVMATNLRVSRETTVIAARGGGYRRLSVREASSVQGFPITYQWWGTTASMKYKLVGNAVAPPVAYALASEILRSARRPIPERPLVLQHLTEAAPLGAERGRRRSLPLTRRFREHVPGSKMPGFRVDLDNAGRANGHAVGWRAVLYRGSGKALKQRQVSLDEALRLLGLTIADATTEKRARALLSDLEEGLGRLVPDATTLQKVRAEQIVSDVTPYLILERIGRVVVDHFQGETRVVRLDAQRDPDFVPARIAAALVATAYVSELANVHPRKPRLRLSSRTGSNARSTPFTPPLRHAADGPRKAAR